MTPKTKITIASVALLALGVAAGIHGVDATRIARALLAVVALAGLGGWLLRSRRANPALAAPRVAIVARTGLAHRTGVALVEIDGRPFLVVHGDGFANVSAIPERRVRKQTAAFKAALRSAS
jgi:flagellar protein FliO/FliZ